MIPAESKNLAINFPHVLVQRQIGLNEKHRRNSDAWKYLKNWLTQNEGPMLKVIARQTACSSRTGLLHDSQLSAVKRNGGRKQKTTYDFYVLNSSWKRPFVSLDIPQEVKDIDFARGPISQNIRSEFFYGSCFYCLTSTSVYIFNSYSGKLVDSAIISQSPVCSEIYLDSETSSLCVKSSKSKLGSEDLLFTFFFYHYQPLRYFNLLEVRQSVFDKSVKDAEINQGLLITLHQNNVICLYGLNDVLQGKNVILLRVHSLEHQFFIGGNPFFFITVVDHSKFQVHLLKENKIVKNGLVHCDDLLLDAQVGFHPDESARLLVTHKSCLKIYKMELRRDEFHMVHLVTYTQAGSSVNFPTTSLPATTSSGRRIKRKNSENDSHDLDESIRIAWDYEDELDVLGILFAEEREKKCRLLHLDLTDAKSGKILRRIKLSHSFKTGLNMWSVGLRLDAFNAIFSFSGKGKNELLIYKFTAEDLK